MASNEHLSYHIFVYTHLFIHLVIFVYIYTWYKTTIDFLTFEPLSSSPYYLHDVLTAGPLSAALGVAGALPLVTRRMAGRWSDFQHHLVGVAFVLRSYEAWKGKNKWKLPNCKTHICKQENYCWINFPAIFDNLKSCLGRKSELPAYGSCCDSQRFYSHMKVEIDSFGIKFCPVDHRDSFWCVLMLEKPVSCG